MKQPRFLKDDFTEELRVTIEETTKKKEIELVFLSEAPRQILSLLLKMRKLDLHIGHLTNGKKMKNDLDNDGLSETLKAKIEGNELFGFMLFDIVTEFERAIRDMICGSYRSTYRTYRFIIELLVYGLDFQLETETGAIITQHVLESNKRWNNETYLTELGRIQNIMQARFEERLRFMGKYKSPGLKIIIDKIFLFSNKPDWQKNKLDVDRSVFKTKLLQLYSNLSRFVHLSLETKQLSEEYIRRMERPQGKHSMYDEKQFEQCLQTGYHLLDMILATSVLFYTWFFNYVYVGEFVSVSAEACKNFLATADTVGNIFPISKSILTKGS